MKILLVSDLHLDPTKFFWVLEKADSVDAVLLAGDFLNIFSREGIHRQIPKA